MTETLFRLPARSILTLTGPDARSLLQRVITADVETLEAGQCRPGALLTPQGKIISDFMIFGRTDGLWLDVHESAAEALKKRLTLYKLKADVAIALDEALMPVWSPSPFDGAATDPRLTGVFRAILPSDGTEIRSLDAVEIPQGVPAFGRDYGEAEVFPTDVNLDVYGGVGWTKGCFIGQEVVSRMKRRGTIRKRSLAVAADAPLQTGASITAGSSTIGEISAASGHNAVGRVRLDRLEAASETLMVGDIEVRIDLPDALKPEPAPQKV
ncbi:hypothetical protein [Maricaulis sp.]|uniref:CAF17-like 4Fe-4S cluster assembly/insertion protein YgfZ n=1 Tax=Maricaulis sp. TaxID=1486257 RepID=UPI0026030854|nr:hypothetical protein [Maricaulis sp.]